MSYQTKASLHKQKLLNSPEVQALVSMGKIASGELHEYCKEAEHMDGESYWLMFDNAFDLARDILLYYGRE